jgi:type I restriction enzyme, S subunit
MKIWEKKKLVDVCGFVRGPFGGSLKKNIFKTDGYAVYEQQHAIYDQFEDVRYFIDENKFNEMKRFELKSGDLIMSCSGTMGKIAIVPENIKKGIINQALLKLTPSPKKISTVFLKLWMQSESFQDSLKEYSGGAAIQNVASVAILKQIEIPLPPLPEQQRIVAILDEAFTAIAKAKANAEQNLKNAKELFESYLNAVDAEKVSLGNLVDIKTGKLNSNASVENGQYPFFTCSREVFAIDDYAFDLEAILLAGNNASGDFNVKHYKGKFNAYQRTYVITVNEKQAILYRYLYFQLLKSLKEFKDMSVGANTRFLKLGMIQGLQIALPTLNEQQIIVQKLNALSTETKRLEAIYQQKILELEELKKSVLQKAFNGEL